MATDVAQIWNSAIVRYKEAAGFDKSFDINTLSSATNIEDVVCISDNNLKKFQNFRHDGGGCDKFRTFVADHLEPIEKVAEFVADAASGAFPPSTAIFKVIQYLLQVATDARADYERVEEFFSKLGSYLRSLKILEGHVPNIDELREALMRVMSCLLVICGISTKYIKDQRWRTGLKKMLHVGKNELNSAYADLETSLAEETRAVHLAQLRIGQETKVDVREGRMDQRETHFAVLQGLDMNTETLRILKHMERKQNQELDKNDLNYLEEVWENVSFDTSDYDDIECNYLKGTGAWVLEQPAYQSWARGENCFLWLSGPPGTGKSYLTYSIIQDLRAGNSSGSQKAVAVIYFNNTKEKARSVKAALCNLILQIAESDAIYRKRVAARVKNGAVAIGQASIETIWTKYVRELLQLPSSSTFYLIIDGVDKAVREEWMILLRLLSDIPRYELPLQVLLSGRSELDLSIASVCDPQKTMVRVEKSKNCEDIEKVVREKFNQTIQLKRVAKDAEQIIKSLVQNAEGMFLYVDLVLKELDNINQWPAVLTALKRLPHGLTELYDLSLATLVEKTSSPEETSFIKALLTWVALVKRPLSLYQYSCLMELGIICRDYSIENELESRCARYVEGMACHGRIPAIDCSHHTVYYA